MYILLQYNKNTDTKGILIFTHNETGYLAKHFPSLKKYFLVQHVQFGLRYSRHPLINLHMIPSPNYDNEIPIATHILIEGCFNANEPTVDVNTKLLHLLQKYNIRFNIDNVENKLFDFLYVGRCLPLKKTADVIRYFEYAVSALNATCCMILLDQKGTGSDYKSRVVKYHAKLKPDVRSKILLINTSSLNITDNPYYFGLRLEDVALFYKTSKVYMHACQNEGGSRAIHEGLNSGCIVMAKKGMTGGGLNNLNIQNAVLYTNNNVRANMKVALSKADSYQPDPDLIKKISVLHMEDTLLRIFYNRFGYSSKMTYEQFHQSCDKGLWQLKIAAHYLLVPWYTGGLTSTIKSDRSYAKFCQSLNI